MIYYKKGYKYQLHETYQCRVDIEIPETIRVGLFLILESPLPGDAHVGTSLLTIRAGYAWDGASGPTLDTKKTMRPSLVHDALYQLIRSGKLDRKWRKQADLEFKKHMLDAGMWTKKAKLWYWMVRKIAWIGVRPVYARKVLTAP